MSCPRQLAHFGVSFLFLCAFLRLNGVGAQNQFDNELAGWSDVDSEADYRLANVSTQFEGLRECPQGTDDEINECFRLLIEDLRPFYVTGLPKIGLPPLEPLRLADTSVRALGLEVSLRNIEIHGYSEYEALQLTVNSARGSFDAYFGHKHLRMTLDYEIKGGSGSSGFFAGRAGGGSRPRPVEVHIYGYRVNSSTTLTPGRRADGSTKWILSDHKHFDRMDKIEIKIPSLQQRSRFGNWLLGFLNANAVQFYAFFGRPYVQRLFHRFVTVQLNEVDIPPFLPVPTESNPKFSWGSA